MRRFTILLYAVALCICGLAMVPETDISRMQSTFTRADKEDYSHEFIEKNIEATLRAKREMPWGDSVPEDLFVSFVFPLRVNNEALDTSRLVFYRELKPRVENKSMLEAILEVNHWCHEKVSYQPSDGRTSSPLSTLSQSTGRCGEESTFTVAALRSVGIPARQVYTPRWAHTDDNHAWVEAWADGKWHFLGACEPEPVLDLAWFNAPASRAMLMTTNVFGPYEGDEEVIGSNPRLTRLNVTSNYVPTGKLTVEVVDTIGRPVENARVDFCIYNYAEYSPVVTKETDKSGRTSLTAGLGDLMVWGASEGKFGYGKGRPAPDGTLLRIVLDKDERSIASFDETIVPPAGSSNIPEVTAQQREENNRRLAAEDSIRKEYQKTFISDEEAAAIAARLGLDKRRLTAVLKDSRGNHKRLVECLEEMKRNDRSVALTLLENIEEKDRRDIGADVIIDAVRNSRKYSGTSDFWARYVLNPRIELEHLRPWRSKIQQMFGKQEKVFRKNPRAITEWINRHVHESKDENFINQRTGPIALLECNDGDETSRNILFVAIARSMGIPARINPSTGIPEYSTYGEKWEDARLPEFEDYVSPAGGLKITLAPESGEIDPVYYTQFSLSKIENGVPRLLDFEDGSTLKSLFSEPCAMEPGQYLLTTGQRMADGSVLAHSDIFQVLPGEDIEVEMQLRHDDSKLSVIGSLNAENIYHNIEDGTDKSVLSTTGRGYYVLGLIEPNHEPSAHALNDISAVADKMDALGLKTIILFENADKAARFERNRFGQMPQGVAFGIDNDGTCKKEIMESLQNAGLSMPIFVIADTFNRIVWKSDGYTIGLGETLMKHIQSLK